MLRRAREDVTSVGVYFGGSSARAHQACYYNENNTNVYSAEGYAEAVAVDVPGQYVATFFKAYFKDFVEVTNGVWVREDDFDVGSGYRSMIGFPGGIHNHSLMKLLIEEDPHKTQFIEARGGDNDTLGENKVWIYDTTAQNSHQQPLFPIFQSELCLQFHNNQTGTYPKKYHEIKGLLMKSGRLKATGCPVPDVYSCP